jgi:hypothetical protein
VPFDGEISPGQCRPPIEPAQHISLQASSGKERRLHSERLELVAGTDVGVDEYRPAVSPRLRAGIDRCHL